MRSASSTARYRREDARSSRCAEPWSIMAQRRPGVATMTAGRCSKTRSCLACDIPPTRVSMRMLLVRGTITLRRCLATWTASSRVGVRIKAASPSSGAGGLVIRPFKMGRPKAKVLPEPVSAAPRISTPFCIALGKHIRWIGVGLENLQSAIPSRRASSNPNSSHSPTALLSFSGFIGLGSCFCLPAASAATFESLASGFLPCFFSSSRRFFS
mmetsp:Transcript_4038/g.8676  ORF Transcript_4038/g.8676 Transcript_4038/m.8676 type:complete len:213 (-) Transcript_4038:611-1249(-)